MHGLRFLHKLPDFMFYEVPKMVEEISDESIRARSLAILELRHSCIHFLGRDKA